MNIKSISPRGLAKFYATIAIVVAGAASGSAATIIDETFGGSSTPASLQGTGATSNISFNGSDVYFGGFADAGRSYLRTIDKNFFTQSFTAEVTLSTGGHISFFGMGFGGNSPFGAGSYEPLGPSINLRLHPNGVGAGQTDAVTNNGSSFVDFDQFDYPGSQTNQRLRLTWDAGAQTAVFAVDYGYNGTFFADASSAVLNGAGLGLSDSNTSIFFGGSNGARFDDFVVTTTSNNVPDGASTLVLLSLGLLLSLKLRRNISR